jgi:hypothetical protein
VLISSHRKLLSSKTMVVNVAEKSERDRLREATASEPLMTCRKRIRRRQNRRRAISSGISMEGVLLTVHAASDVAFVIAGSS